MKWFRTFDIRQKLGFIGAILGVWLAGNLVATFLVILPRNERAETIRDAVDEFRQARIERDRSVGSLRTQFNRVMDGKRSLRIY